MTSRAGTIRLLLVDDHAAVRVALRASLEKSERIRVVGEAGDGEEGLALSRAVPSDVALVDLSMPKMDGLQLIRELRQASESPYAIVYSHEEGPESVARAQQAGARGYLSKGSATSEQLLDAVVRVAEGETCFPSPEREDSRELTPREKQIAVLIAKGMSGAEIAAFLGRGVGTVQTYRANISRKWGAATTAELTREVVDRGWLEDEE